MRTSSRSRVVRDRRNILSRFSRHSSTTAPTSGSRVVRDIRTRSRVSPDGGPARRRSRDRTCRSRSPARETSMSRRRRRRRCAFRRRRRHRAEHVVWLFTADAWGGNQPRHVAHRTSEGPCGERIHPPSPRWAPRPGGSRSRRRYPAADHLHWITIPPRLDYTVTAAEGPSSGSSPMPRAGPPLHTLTAADCRSSSGPSLSSPCRARPGHSHPGEQPARYSLIARPLRADAISAFTSRIVFALSRAEVSGAMPVLTLRTKASRQPARSR